MAVEVCWKGDHHSAQPTISYRKTTRVNPIWYMRIQGVYILHHKEKRTQSVTENAGVTYPCNGPYICVLFYVLVYRHRNNVLCWKGVTLKRACIALSL